MIMAIPVNVYTVFLSLFVKLVLLNSTRYRKNPSKPKIAPLAPTWLYVSGLIRKVAILARIPVVKKKIENLKAPSNFSRNGPKMASENPLNSKCVNVLCRKMG